jgi:hypothetical protein
MNAEERTKILVAGGRKLPAQLTRRFVDKKLYVAACDLSEITEATAPAVFAGAKALLVAHPPGQYGALNEVFLRVAILATREGLAIGYLPCEASDVKRAARLMAEVPILELKEGGTQWVYIQRNIGALAELLGQHNPGPPSGTASIVIVGEEFSLPPEHRRLLLRAFWDASNVAIEKLPGGAASSGAYRVYASLVTRYGPQEPTPFVFKVDRPDKVRDECNNYREFVQPSVPFHLHPGLVEARCVTTPDLAALVCNFAEGAVALEAALSKGQGAGVIFSLFETTLRGFRQQTLSSTPFPNVVRDYVKDRVKIERLRGDPEKLPRIAQAKDLGFSGEPEDLQAAIAQRAEGMESLHGVVHGDLHMGNVMVRNCDAIAIDFGSMRDEKRYEGPLTADPAALEASIAFGTRKEEAIKQQPEWVKFIDQIYREPLELPIPTPDHFHFAWVNRAIREVRHIVHCCGVTDEEALLVLSASLLRYGRFSAPLFRDPALRSVSEQRKAYAMVKAQQIFGKIPKR